MNVTRIHSMEFETKKALKKRMKAYRKQAREQFPEAELLMTTRTSPRSILTVSAYPDQEAADRADKMRAKRVATLKKATCSKVKLSILLWELLIHFLYCY